MKTDKKTEIVHCDKCGKALNGKHLEGFATICPKCAINDYDRTKPITDLMTEKEWQSRRILNLIDALERYQRENLTPPLIWIHELRKLIAE
tara:strand:+ start:277 stop:549 length:273 start_codon:yes stop_codon:yes gene_type:complete